jgi:hypothetical protein
MNTKPESIKAYFPAQTYYTLDLKATPLSASSVQVYRAKERRSKFTSIFSLSKMHADATFRVEELFLNQENYIKMSGGMARTCQQTK